MTIKTIDTLVSDIYLRLESILDVKKENSDEFGKALSSLVMDRLQRERDSATLRMSNIGSPCERKLWYSVNEPERGESLTGKERLKFTYGDVLEELLLYLAQEAGHTVTHRQAEVEIDGVKGHIDCIIDGRLCDVKSASSQSFRKFKEHLLEHDDVFGYLDQLNGYLFAIVNGPLSPSLIDRDVFSFLAIDKQHGSLTLDTYPSNGRDYRRFIALKKAILDLPEPPDRLPDVPEGAYGNRRLGTVCSYCNFKHHCWEGLRTFNYSSGPVYLTKVVREPKVSEKYTNTK